MFELYLSLSLDAASQVLEKHEEEFFEVVDAKLNLLRLKRKKVITESLVTKIDSADSANARELLYDHLYHNADVPALREYCKMAVAADAVPKMQKLGEKMLSELPPDSVNALVAVYLPVPSQEFVMLCQLYHAVDLPSLPSLCRGWPDMWAD